MTRHSFTLAKAYGELVYWHSQQPGAHNTPAAEERNNVLSHIKGKYGEIAFFRWLLKKGLLPSHTPFRNNYMKKVENDDFVVNEVRVEVKAKRRGPSSPFPPKQDYNVNLGKSGLEESIYVFIEICGRGNFSDVPRTMLLGWATPTMIRNTGVQKSPDSVSDGGNFEFRRYDWDIQISSLNEPHDLEEYFRARRDAVAAGRV